MADNRTISQLEAERFDWIACECCKGTVWVPFRMIQAKLPMLSAMTLDEVGEDALQEMRQPARAILSSQAERRARLCAKLLDAVVAPVR